MRLFYKTIIAAISPSASSDDDMGEYVTQYHH